MLKRYGSKPQPESTLRSQNNAYARDAPSSLKETRTSSSLRRANLPQRDKSTSPSVGFSILLLRIQSSVFLAAIMTTATKNSLPANPLPQTPVHVYIDNSNLWIQGQKTYAERRGLHTSWDPTWRFDVGRLKRILMDNPKLQSASSTSKVDFHLYGSTPPPVDSVWAAIKSHDVTVRTFPRSTWTRREKQVDNGMSLHSALQAESDKNAKVRSEFMIISGDRDLHLAVEEIAARGFPVHVWSWKNSLSRVYAKYRTKPGSLVQVYLLDENLNTLGFCQTTFQIDRSIIDPNSIVFLDPLPKHEEIKLFVDNLKVPYYQYECEPKREAASSSDAVVIPAFARSMKHKDLVDLFNTAKKILEPCGLEVITYLEYCQRFYGKHEKEQELVVSRRYYDLANPRDAIDRDEAVDEQADGDDLQAEVARIHLSKEEERLEDIQDDQGGYVKVDRRAQQHNKQYQRKEKRLQNLCFYGKYCHDVVKCGFGHTREHETYFKTYGSKPLRKQKLCQNARCTRGSRDCTYAHGKEELFCPLCDRAGTGHGVGFRDCPTKKQLELNRL